MDSTKRVSLGDIFWKTTLRMDVFPLLHFPDQGPVKGRRDAG